MKNINVKRPGTGIPAAQLENILGKTAANDIEIDSILKWDDIIK